MEDLTQEQESELRSQLADEIWNDGEPVVEARPEPLPEQPEEQEQPVEEQDPWAGVNPALRAMLESLSSKVSSIDNIHQSVKEWSGRIGAIQREFALQKKAEENKPSKEQQARSAEIKEQLKQLQEDFPEVVSAIDDTKVELEARLERELAAVRERLDQGSDMSPKLAEIERKYEVKLLTMKHPDWKQTVVSPEYKQWLVTQPAEIQTMADESNDAFECSQILDRFTARPKKTAADVQADRQQRLASSEAIQGKQRPIKTKSVDDMTPEEYRAYIAKDIWSN